MKNLILVFGGRSVEHDISILTAISFSSNYMGENKLASLYIDKEGKWFFCDKRLDKNMFKNGTPKEFVPVTLFEGDNYLYTKTMFGYKKVYKIDAVINCCHGGEGERGELNYVFSRSGIAISSGSSLGLAISMNKAIAKVVFKANNIPSPEYVCIEKTERLEERLGEIERLKYPLIVKPNSLGSSIGVKKVKNRKELIQAINVAFEFDRFVIIEKLVENLREFNCAVILGAGEELVSRVDEPVTAGEVFSFSDKYLQKPIKGKTKMGQKHAENLPEKLETEIKQLSLKTVKALDLYGVVRVDYLYDTKHKKLYCNEVNSVPGSLAYFLFDKMTQTKLVDKLAIIAESEKQRTVNIKKEYITNIFN